MKLIVKNNCGEETVAVSEANGCISHFFTYRPERLNLNDTLSGIIRKHDQFLNGYFVETDKKWSVFVPSKEKHNEGECVFIKVTKEARQGKDANGVFISQPENDANSLANTIAQEFQIDSITQWDDETQEAL